MLILIRLSKPTKSDFMKDKLGMKEQKIPEFSLPNSRGETVNIRAYEQESNVIIALLRKPE
ncbi:MAG: hypothetical protein BAJALOKI2v1_90066 [Promethearchaeota archaeon]|nr:MAG: hypothetical protein BAJALOKI2v1_90066 [Candidatus Lokiarchaeota archaeon]